MTVISLLFALIAGLGVYTGVQSLLLYTMGHVSFEYLDGLVGHHQASGGATLVDLTGPLSDATQYHPFDMVRIYDGSGHIVFERRYRHEEQLALVAPLGAGTSKPSLPTHQAMRLANHGIAIQSFHVVPFARTAAAGSSNLIEFTEVIEHAQQVRLDQISVFAALAAMGLAGLMGLVAYPAVAALVDRNSNLVRQVEFAYINLLKSLGIAISRRDSETGEHCYRTTLVAIAIGEAMQLELAPMRSLIAGSLLHDMGKIAIDDAILRKPGKFTPEEMDIMRGHVNEGVRIVGDLHTIPGATDIVAFHHERWDGKGYPNGLAGLDIPLLARIFAVADVFDALSARRKYKEPFSFDRAMGLIREGAGTHFDADIVVHFETIAAGLYDRIENHEAAETIAMLDAKLAQYFSEAAGFEIGSVS
ncbi:HD-GYP domain-containing protein [Polymorphobacter arshaanensis]|nr:HD-GYP domain-containing protein [Polymorphobacter arshaanensis]